MNKMVYVFALAACLLIAAYGSASAAFLGGNDTIVRSYVDGATGITFIDVNHRIISDGEIDSWSVYAVAGRTMRLKIFRENGDNYDLVGSSPFVTTTFGGQTFSFATPISVKVGDIIGWYYTSGSAPGTGIYFDNSSIFYGNTLWTTYPGSEITGSVSKTTFLTGYPYANRVYSISVEGTTAVPLPGALLLLGSGLAGLAGIRRRLVKK
ncbi:MAG: PEP-CTERM sorting domain-containing protein [Proteobacteria bacterium]|nr:PEP-CTERM sorting domain-containing protein [Pseudomonadota bacterium]